MLSAYIGGEMSTFLIVLCNHGSYHVILENHVLWEMIGFIVFYKWEFVTCSEVQLCIASLPVRSPLTSTFTQTVLLW